MKAILPHTCLQKKACSPFEKSVYTLIVDDSACTPIHNTELFKLLLVESKDPFCLWQKILSLLMVQDIRGVDIVRQDNLQTLVSLDTIPSFTWIENIYYCVIKCHLAGDSKALLSLLKSVVIPYDFKSQAQFLLLCGIIGLLSKNPNITNFVRHMVLDILPFVKVCKFRNMFTASHESFAMSEPLNSICLGIKSLKIQSLDSLFTSTCNLSSLYLPKEEAITFFHALVSDFIDKCAFSNAEKIDDKSCAPEDFLELSLEKNESCALGSFSFQQLFVPAFGFENPQEDFDQFFHHNRLLSSVLDKKKNNFCSLISLGDSQGYCHFDAALTKNSLSIQVHSHAKVTTNFCLFLRADSLISSNQDVIRRLSLHQFEGEVKILHIVREDKKYSLQLNTKTPIQVKPLAGHCHFWTADFLLIFRLEKGKHIIRLTNYSLD